MSRITRIVPTTVLTIAALALVAPAAQAKPSAFTSGGTAYANPSVQSTQDANYGTTYANPSVQSTQDVNYGTHVRSVVVTTGDMPLANPVKGSADARRRPDARQHRAVAHRLSAPRRGSRLAVERV